MHVSPPSDYSPTFFSITLLRLYLYYTQNLDVNYKLTQSTCSGDMTVSNVITLLDDKQGGHCGQEGWEVGLNPAKNEFISV